MIDNTAVSACFTFGLYSNGRGVGGARSNAIHVRAPLVRRPSRRERPLFTGHAGAFIRGPVRSPSKRCRLRDGFGGRSKMHSTEERYALTTTIIVYEKNECSSVFKFVGTPDRFSDITKLTGIGKR